MSDVMIKADKLSKRYDDVHALKEASFEVRRGEVVGFLGPNGAGKTTTMKILTCFTAPTTGTAVVHGSDVFTDALGARRAIGYLPESTPLYHEMLVVEYLEFVANMRGFRGVDARRRIKKVVEQTDLGSVIGKSIRTLSKGFKQRVGLAQALVHEPPILILDEPLSGLDPNQASGIRKLIKEIGQERTVILSTHNLAEVQVTCGRVLIISGGSIVADDTPDELVAAAGKQRYAVVLGHGEKISEKAEQVRALFEHMEGALSVRLGPTESASEVALEIVPKGSEDLRGLIFQTAVENDLVLLGLERKGQNLESIFRELTTNQGNTENRNQEAA